MNFTFHDEHGREINITDFETFKNLLTRGQIQSNTLLFDRDAGLWKLASEHDVYHAAINALHAPQTVDRPAADYGAVTTGTPPPYSQYDAYAPPSEKGWLIALAAVCLLVGVAILLGAIISFSANSYEAGYRFGQAMGGTFLVILITFFIWRFPKKKSKGAGLAIFAAGFLLVSLGNSLSAWRSYHEQKRVFQDLSSMVSDLNSGKELSLRDVDEKKYGEMAPMMKVISEFMQTVMNDFQEMNRQMQEQQMGTLLRRETLQDVAHIDAGQKRLQAILEILDRTEALQRQRADEVVSRINNSDLTEKQKREFLSGFNRTKEQSLGRLSEFFRLERETLAKIDDILNFLRGKQKRYSFSGDQILFQSQADANEYNALLDQIQMLAHQQQEEEWKPDPGRRSLEK